VQETCWKPYLSDRNLMLSKDDDGNDAGNSTGEVEAAICECLRQYIQHYIDVCSAFL